MSLVLSWFDGRCDWDIKMCVCFLAIWNITWYLWMAFCTLSCVASLIPLGTWASTWPSQLLSSLRLACRSRQSLTNASKVWPRSVAWAMMAWLRRSSSDRWAWKSCWVNGSAFWAMDSMRMWWVSRSLKNSYINVSTNQSINQSSSIWLGTFSTTFGHLDNAE